VAFFHGITHRNYLNLRHREETRHFAQPLRAATDMRQRDFLAWGDKSGSAQHVPRHNRKPRRRYAG